MSQTKNFSSLKESVLERLRKDIVTCALLPGEVIRDHELAARYSVSTSPLREALVQLSIERLIEMPPNRLKRVGRLDFKSAMDFFTIYKAVALAGFAWGAGKAGAGYIERMEAIRAALAPALRGGDRYDIAMLLKAFFLPVYEASGNAELIYTITRRLSWIDRLVIIVGPHRTDILMDKFQEIIDALSSHDPDVAIRIHYQLVCGMERDLQRLKDFNPEKFASTMSTKALIGR